MMTKNENKKEEEIRKGNDRSHKAEPNNKGNYDQSQRQTFRTSFVTTPFDIYNCAFLYSFAV